MKTYTKVIVINRHKAVKRLSYFLLILVAFTFAMLFFNLEFYQKNPYPALMAIVSGIAASIYAIISLKNK